MVASLEQAELLVSGRSPAELEIGIEEGVQMQQ